MPNQIQELLMVAQRMLAQDNLHPRQKHEFRNIEKECLKILCDK
jgi:hypothetical protein